MRLFILALVISLLGSSCVEPAAKKHKRKLRTRPEVVEEVLVRAGFCRAPREPLPVEQDDGPNAP